MVKKQVKTKADVTNVVVGGGGDECKKKKYKGVRKRSWGSYVSEIRAPNQKTRIWLGSYSSPEAAARAYDAALLCLNKASSTNLNFPSTSTSTFHQLLSNNNLIMSPKSIQRIAASAAAAATVTDECDVLKQESSNCTHPLPATATATATTATSMMSVEYDISREVTDDTVSMNESWCDEFESPKYLDMVNEFFFNPVVINDCVYEECDIRLWSF